MKKILPFVLVLILLFSVPAFASDDVRAVSLDLEHLFDTPVVSPFHSKVEEKLASGTRATYTLDDLYDLTYDINYGAYVGSSYAPVRMAGYLGNWNSNMLNLDDWLAPYDNGSRVGIGSLILNQTYDLTDIKNYNSNLSSKINSIDSKLLTKYNWLNSPVSNITVRTSIDGTPISGNVSGYDFYVSLSFDSSFDSYLPNVFRIFFPIERFTSTGVSDQSFIHISELSCFVNNNRYQLNVPDYFIEQTATGFYAYFFGFNPYSTDYYTFHVHLDKDATYRYWTSVSASYIPFNTDDYQLMKSAFYQQNLSSDLSAIRQVIASPDKVQAEQNQQAVESQVLDDFTGSGSESMSLNDVAGVKNVSSGAKSFLGTGSSGSSALGIFNVNGSGLWQWFSQTTADNLDTTSRTRDSYLSIYDDNLAEYYRGLD